MKKDRDKNRVVKTSKGDIPRKLKEFEDFVVHMSNVILQGTDKYTGAEKDTAETIDIMPMMVGKKGYIDFVICDITKRLLRFRNDARERDLVKIAVWCYLLYSFLQKKGGKDNVAGD